MADDSTSSLYYPSLVGGVRSSAPPRSLGDPAAPFIWRDALNLTVRDGVVIGRPGFTGGLPGGEAQPTFTVPVGLAAVVELPRWVYYDGIVAVYVTNSEIYVYYSGTWRNVTPTYSDGTITATNGSTAISGAGTAWRTRGIVGGVIRIDSTDYTFLSSTDTTATLGGNYTGATGAGKSYSIRRTFGGYGASLSFLALVNAGDIYATIYNGDLYVAVNNAYQIVGGNGSTSVVIKVSDIYTTGPSATYLTAGGPVTTGVDYISGLLPIVGLDVLQDGRVVVAAGSSIYYSSHLNTAVWTAAPGGETPIAEAPGRLTGMGRIGAALTVHHQRGIVWADPTGLSDPPLRFQSTAAHVGTGAPHTIAAYQEGEAFLAADGDVKFFDGNVVQSMGDHEIGYRLSQLIAAEGTSGFLPFQFWAWVNPRRNQYVLWRIANDVTSATKFWAFEAATAAWWPCETALVVGAMSAAVGTAGNTYPDIVGVSGSKSDTGNTLRGYREGAAESGSTPTYFLETDDVDGGVATVLKTPQRAAVWPVATMDDLTVGVRRADDTTYISMTADPLSTNRPKWFDFQPGQVGGAVAADTAHRWKLSGTALRLGVFALLLRWAVGGEKEKVTTG